MISEIDKTLITFFKQIANPFARFGIFLVFFWFGILKVIGVSPATPLVQHLFERTISFMPFDTFLILFGLFEMVIGMLFLIKGLERMVMPLLAIHVVTTAMPLFLLPQETWNGFLIPTLEGQYILKNVLIIALAVVIAAQLTPLSDKRSRLTK